GRVAGAEAIHNALAVLEAQAVADGPEEEVFIRVAHAHGRVYLSLGDQAMIVVEIDAAGWRGCPEPPVPFRHPPGQLALPVPQKGGNIDDLRTFVNVDGDDSFGLMKAWAEGSFQEGSKPVGALMGEQGTAKTTTARMLKRLIDPHKMLERAE